MEMMGLFLALMGNFVLNLANKACKGKLKFGYASEVAVGSLLMAALLIVLFFAAESGAKKIYESYFPDAVLNAHAQKSHSR